MGDLRRLNLATTRLCRLGRMWSLGLKRYFFCFGRRKSGMVTSYLVGFMSRLRIRATPADAVKQPRALKSCNIKHGDAPANALNRSCVVKFFRDPLYSSPRALYLKHQSSCSIWCCILKLSLVGAFWHGGSSPELSFLLPEVVVRLPAVALTSSLSAHWSWPPPPPRPPAGARHRRCLVVVWPPPELDLECEGCWRG